jgi:hypothetical protein
MAFYRGFASPHLGGRKQVNVGPSQCQQDQKPILGTPGTYNPSRNRKLLAKRNTLLSHVHICSSGFGVAGRGGLLDFKRCIVWSTVYSYW